MKRHKLVPAILAIAICGSIVPLVWFNSARDRSINDGTDLRGVVFEPLVDASRTGAYANLATVLTVGLQQRVIDHQRVAVVPMPEDPRPGLAAAEFLVSGSILGVDDAVTVTVSVTNLTRQRRFWNDTFTGDRNAPADLQEAIGAALDDYFDRTR